MKTSISEGDTTVIIPMSELRKPHLKTSILAREWTREMTNKKDDKLNNSKEFSRDIIKTLIDTLSEDKEMVRNELTEERKLSDKKFTEVFNQLKPLNKMETKFKLYEKVLGAVCLAILYFILDKFL